MIEHLYESKQIKKFVKQLYAQDYPSDDELEDLYERPLDIYRGRRILWKGK